MRDGLYNNLVDSLVAKIKALIQTGDMRGQLQCERDLSKRFAVGRATIRRALTVLERDGWIGAPNGKKARMILNNVVDDNDVGEVSVKMSLIHGKVGFLTSVSLKYLPQPILAEIMAVEELLVAEQLTVKIMFAPWAKSHNPDRRLLELVKKSQCNCWVLYHASEATQMWFKKQGIPCLVRGVSYETSSLPHIDKDWRAVAQHAAAYLWRQGHRKVALCLPDEPLRGNELLKTYFNGFSGEGWNPVIISSPFETDSFIQRLQSKFASHPDITAFVAARCSQLVPLTSWLASHRLKVGEDKSIV